MHNTSGIHKKAKQSNEDNEEEEGEEEEVATGKKGNNKGRGKDTSSRHKLSSSKNAIKVKFDEGGAYFFKPDRKPVPFNKNDWEPRRYKDQDVWVCKHKDIYYYAHSVLNSG